VTTLSLAERERYARQIALPEIGEAGQARWRAATVLIVGVGGLGSPAALYLAAAGIGTLVLVDRDAVELSNLSRQILYDTPTLGEPKLVAARRRLQALNPSTQIVLHPEGFHVGNARALVREATLVLDGSDNFATHYLVNDACVLEGKTLVSGSAAGFAGRVTLIEPGRGPCYRCLHPAPPPPELAPSCAAGGVLGVAPGLVGVWQAAEALKYLAGIGEPLRGRVLHFDLAAGRTRELRFARDPDCALCGEYPTLHDVQARSPNPCADECSLAELASAPALLDVREATEVREGMIPGARWIPLRELAARCGELDASTSLICYCGSGQRSLTALQLLRRHGFTQVRSLRGGYAAYLNARPKGLHELR
jgi:molybdopterin/thiamine biosynthesis adenylyltransferase/rhodanese-related sulfurtransferase